jgi:hypothetical protein
VLLGCLSVMGEPGNILSIPSLGMALNLEGARLAKVLQKHSERRLRSRKMQIGAGCLALGSLA